MLCKTKYDTTFELWFCWQFNVSINFNIQSRSTQVRTGPNILLWDLHSGNTVTHGRISNQAQTELKPYRPGPTRIDRSVTCVNSWWISGVGYGREIVLLMLICSHGFQSRIYVCIDPDVIVLACTNPRWKTALILVIYCNVISETGLTRPYVRLILVDRVRTDIKRVCIRFETRKHFEHNKLVFSSIIVPPELTCVSFHKNALFKALINNQCQGWDINTTFHLTE